MGASHADDARCVCSSTSAPAEFQVHSHSEEPSPTDDARPGDSSRSSSSSPAGLVIQGQEPLTASMLAAAPPQEQKQMLGERLFPLIQGMYPELAGKITGMLLEIDNSELVHMLEHSESLKGKVDEAVAVLQAHQSKSNE